MSAALAQPYLDDMKLFAAVVDAGGFRPAAQRLGLPASTVSDVVRRLEERIGLRLLNRSTRSVMPTDAGRRLLAGLRPAFDLIDQAVSGLRDDAERPAGPLRLTAPGIVARYVLPRILPDFLNACPDVHVEVVVDEDVVDIVDGGFDAAIRFEERIAGDMTATPIGPRIQRLAAAAAPAYLALHGYPDHPNGLSSHRLIGHRRSTGAMVVWEFEQGRRTVRVTPSGPLITSSIELRVAAAVAGVGLIYTFEDVLRPQLEAGALAPVLESWWQSFPGPFLCYHGDRRAPGPLRALLTHIQSHASAS
jgi:DNA-binding transcriptional LysR family regulator